MRRVALCLAIAHSVAISACTGEIGNSVSPVEAEAVGGIVMPLTVTTNGRTYRIAGDIAVYLVSASNGIGLSILHDSLDSQTGEVYSMSLRAGTYDVALSNVRVFVNGSREVNFTATSPLSQRVSVFANQSTSLAFSFNVAGTVVHFDPCVPLPDAIACATGDADHDGVSNGVECATPTTSCQDSDGDGLADVNDPDSDNDGEPDGTDPARTDPCAPDAWAVTCSNPPTGTVDVTVNVSESCDAEGQDTCSFEGDTGTTTPTNGTPPLHTPAQPDLNPWTILFYGPQSPEPPTLPVGVLLAVPGSETVYRTDYTNPPFGSGPGAPYSGPYTTTVSIESGSDKITLSPSGGFGAVILSVRATSSEPGWAWITATVTSSASPNSIEARRTIPVKVN